MAKKNVENFEFNNDPENSKRMFTEAFLVALNSGNIYVKGNKIYMETSDTIYTADLAQFSFVWNPSFEFVFKNQFSDLLKIDKIHPNMIVNLYRWMNPVFDEMPIKIKSKDVFLSRLQEKVQKDKEYFSELRCTMLELIGKLDLQDRKGYLDRFIPYGILTEDDKIIFEYYSDYSVEELEQLFKEKEMSPIEQKEIVCQAFAYERRKQNASEKKSKRSYNKKIVGLINLLGISDILDVFMGGVLNEEEFVKTKITKNDLLATPYELLLSILSDKNDSLPEDFKITSKDLVNCYGRSLDGDKIRKLFNYGYIEPQDLIEIFEINKVLSLIEYDEKLFENEDLKAIYTPETLLKMKEGGKITPNFVEKYLEMQRFKENPELFRKNSAELIEFLQDKPDREDASSVQDDILYFFDIGLCDFETTKENISEEYMEEKFMNDELTIEEIFDYYQKGLLGDEAISKYYTQEEILDLYKSGKLKFGCLKAVKNTELLLQAFDNGDIPDTDFARLYLETDNLSVQDFDYALQLSEKEINIGDFITQDTPFSKIKELFSNYLIDYASILELHNQGIINNDELEEIKNALSTREFFEELNSATTYTVVTERTGQSTQKKKIIPSGERKKADFSDELILISEILDIDVTEGEFSLIESYNEKGRPTSLNNYRIFGNEELDGIVILQKSKKENAVFVMSALQMMYFLRGKATSQGQVQIQNRMKDKAYLKTITGVEVVEHTEYFARNLVEAAARISPKIAERVRTDDNKYIADVEEMVTEMRRKYLDAKEKGRDDD